MWKPVFKGTNFGAMTSAPLANSDNSRDITHSCNKIEAIDLFLFILPPSFLPISFSLPCAIVNSHLEVALGDQRVDKRGSMEDDSHVRAVKAVEAIFERYGTLRLV
jgi:hypothetical protein